MTEQAPNPSPEFVGAWRPGARIDRYSLVARIAVGGMAEIWLARLVGLKGFERVVVIKRVLDSLCSDTAFVDMFLDEARLAAQLSHPNIVQIFDLAEHAGAYYIAMEYLHGEDLANVERMGRRAGTPLPPALAARIVAGAAEGLASAHRKEGLDGKPLKLVHRDVSPQNIFVTYEGVVKVLDFGIAKATGQLSKTHEGQFKGKYGYTSPEQLKGDGVDQQTDVWALGVVFFEVLTHSRLFDFKDDHLAAMSAVMGGFAIPTARSRNPEVPIELDEIVGRALQRDRAKRYRTTFEMLTDLEGWLKAQPNASNTHLAAFMTRLFAARITAKTKVIESARHGEVTFVRVPAALRPPGDGSEPSDAGAPRGGRVRRGGAWVAGALALALVGAAAGAWTWLRGRPATVAVTSNPPGAKITIDGVVRGQSPASVDGLAPGPHVVSVDLEGRQGQEQHLSLQAGQNVELRFELPVVPEPAVEPVEPAAGSTPDAGPTRPAVARGRLSLQTTPWTRVYLGNRLLGDTPLVEVALPAGRHRLKLVNDEQHISTVIEVQVVAGRTTARRLQL